MVINKIDIVKFILLFFFLARLIRLAIIKLAGNFVFAAVFIDATFLLFILAFVFYLFNSGKISFKIDGVGIMYCALLLLGVLQGAYFLTIIKGSGGELFLKSFFSFRKYFLPLLIFPVFNLLLINEIRCNPAAVAGKILAFMKIILFLALIYGFTEYILRTFLSGFNDVYTRNFIYPLLNVDAESNSGAVSLISGLYRTYLWGYLGFFRISGICLDYHVSGAVIFICYLFYVFFSNKFKIFSWLNLFVFLAMILTGSSQFSLPFIIFNLYYFIKYGKADRFLKASVGVLLVVSIMGVTLPAITNFDETFGIFLRISPSIVQNYDKFIMGQGPIRMLTEDVSDSMIKPENTAQAVFLERVTDFGFFTALLEIGMILFIGLLIFFWKATFSHRRSAMDDPDGAKMVSNLRIIIIFCLLTFLGHRAILFDRTISVFFILILSLAYSLQQAMPIRSVHERE